MMSQSKKNLKYVVMSEKDPYNEEEYRFKYLSPRYTGHVSANGAHKECPDHVIEWVNGYIEKFGSMKEYVKYLYDLDEEDVMFDWRRWEQKDWTLSFLTWPGSPYIDKVYCKNGE